MNKKTPYPFDYDQLVENMVDGLFAVDENCVITYWNKAAEDMLGYKKEEIIGQKCDFLNSTTCMGQNLRIPKSAFFLPAVKLFASGVW